MLTNLFVYLQTMAARIGKDEEGQTLVEYGLIIGLVSVVLIATLQLMTGALDGIFTAITTALGKA